MRLIFLAIIQSVLLCSGQVFLKFALQKMGAFDWKGSFFVAQLTNAVLPMVPVRFFGCTSSKTTRFPAPIRSYR